MFEWTRAGLGSAPGRLCKRRSIMVVRERVREVVICHLVVSVQNCALALESVGLRALSCGFLRSVCRYSHFSCTLMEGQRHLQPESSQKVFVSGRRGKFLCCVESDAPTNFFLLKPCSSGRSVECLSISRPRSCRPCTTGIA